MKKILALLLALAMVFALCACGGSTGSPTATPSEAPTDSEAPAEPGAYEVTEPITIVWWHALEDQYSELVSEVVDGFNNSQDLITVEAQYIGAYKDLSLIHI